MEELGELDFRPVTEAQWPDLQALFGPSGACGGCWCMWWRLKRAEFARQAGQGNRRAMERLIRSGEVPGILAYGARQPVGWCSVAPREAFPVLDRSPALKRVDDRPVWSIVCFYVAPRWRGRGLSRRLIEAAVAYARERGARLLEAYPVDPSSRKLQAGEAYTGLLPVFLKSGFREVLRRPGRRVIVRRELA